MNDKFDELAKGLAQSVTRRQALRRFGVGLAGAVLAGFGLGNAKAAKPVPGTCCIYKCLTRVGVNFSRICEPVGVSCPPPTGYSCALNSETPVLDCKFCQ